MSATNRVRETTEGGAQVLLENVTRRHGSDVNGAVYGVRDVNLHIRAGSSTALVGPSGSGKSTLLQLIGGMDRPDTGRILVDGAVLNEMRPRNLTLYRRRVGFVFQAFHLMPALTVLDNVLVPVLSRRVDFDAPARAQELLNNVGLGDRVNSMPSELSGGQQQRVAIARALIARPPLVLADEPTGNLDSLAGDRVLELLLDLMAEYGATIMLATHNSAVADRCQTTLSLLDGRVQEQR